MYERINNKQKKEIFVLKFILNAKDNVNKSIIKNTI